MFFVWFSLLVYFVRIHSHASLTPFVDFGAPKLLYIIITILEYTGCVRLAFLCRPRGAHSAEHLWQELIQRTITRPLVVTTCTSGQPKWPVLQAGHLLISGADPGEPLKWRKSYSNVPGSTLGSLSNPSTVCLCVTLEYISDRCWPFGISLIPPEEPPSCPVSLNHWVPQVYKIAKRYNFRKSSCWVFTFFLKQRLTVVFSFIEIEYALIILFEEKLIATLFWNLKNYSREKRLANRANFW